MEYAQRLVERYKALDCILSIEDVEEKLKSMDGFLDEIEKDLERIQIQRVDQFYHGLMLREME